jgi:hypothetical protein
MRFCLLALCLTMLPLAAVAQEAEEPAPGAEETTAAQTAYSPYVADGYGFSIELPDSGAISVPGEDGELQDESVAFEWTGAEDDPIVLIQGRVDRFDVVLDPDTFDVFCATLLENWQGDSENYKVVTANDRITIDDFVWNLIEIEDASHADGEMVYYSVFSTYAGSTIYTISMYYLEPVSEGIQEFGIPVLYGFRLAEGTAAEEPIT